MRYMVERNFVQVIGRIWQPGIGDCAMEYPLDAHGVEEIRGYGNGEITRDAVERWVCFHAGDFQEVKDFRCSIGDLEIPWKTEESEFTFSDCMYPAEE